MDTEKQQADLFDQQEKEEKMIELIDESHELIDKVRKMSEELKFKPGGILYPDHEITAVPGIINNQL